MDKLTISVAVFICLLLQPLKAQKVIPVHFTETTELMSTIMYLSGSQEYTMGEISGYQEDIESFFQGMRGHKAVKLVRKIRNGGFGYDKPMAFALRLKVDNGHIVKKNGILDDEEGYLSRWDSRYEPKLIREVDDFYQKSHFHDFYEQHHGLYVLAEDALKVFTDSIEEGWYDRFFGPQENARFEVVASFLNGPANYAATIHQDDGKDIFYAVMGCCAEDENGKPGYHFEEVFPVIIHERNHAYCNPLISSFWNGIKDKAEELFLPEKDFFHRMAYGHPELMMDETFVEASAIFYLQQHGMYIADLYLEYDLQERHYYLIPAMLEAFKERELQRDLYPTMNDFMPELVKAINKTEIKRTNISQ